MTNLRISYSENDTVTIVYHPQGQLYDTDRGYRDFSYNIGGQVYSYADIMTYMANDDFYRYGEENDVVAGNDGKNVIYGGGGDDTLAGGSENDILSGGADVLDGGEGFDNANYQLSQEGITINLATGESDGGDATGDTLISIENVTGYDFDAILTGDGADNQLWETWGHHS